VSAGLARFPEERSNAFLALRDQDFWAGDRTGLFIRG